MVPLVDDCVMEAENKPLLGGVESIVPSHGDRGKLEALGTGRGEGMVKIEVVPSEGKGEVFGTGEEMGVAIIEVVPSKDSFGDGGVALGVGLGCEVSMGNNAALIWV